MILKNAKIYTMEDKIIGVVWRFGKNDYQITLADYSQRDQKKLLEIDASYDEKCSCQRGNADLTIKDANIEFWENEWAKKDKEKARKALAKKGWSICKNDMAFYDDHEGKWFDEKDMYESLGTSVGCAYFLETVLPFYDGSENTNCYYELSMDIIHYMERYLEGE